MKNNSIGFFDSGIGGITIWESVNRLLPNENTIYLVDSKIHHMENLMMN